MKQKNFVELGILKRKEVAIIKENDNGFELMNWRELESLNGTGLIIMGKSLLNDCEIDLERFKQEITKDYGITNFKIG